MTRRQRKAATAKRLRREAREREAYRSAWVEELMAYTEWNAVAIRKMCDAFDEAVHRAVWSRP